jgi:hypothetical protein
MLRFLSVFAIAASLSIALMPKAHAGWCGGFGSNCGCGVVVAAQPCAPEMYLVNQGPVFSGPGHYLHQLADPPPCCYPNVGFVYSGYPYGEYGPGGYPRGSYSPYVGYPYAETYPGFGRWPHGRRHRHYHRSARARR